MEKEFATLQLPDGTSVQLPIRKASMGNDVIDIAPLAKTKYFTFDPGFVATASCESKITYIDGDEGVLLYRGYPIEQLAGNVSYMDICYLLIEGELPTPEQSKQFTREITMHCMVTEQIHRFFSGFRRDAHPMAVICGTIAGLSAFYHDSLDLSDVHNRKQNAIRLIAKIPTIVAMAHKYHIEQPFVYPRNTLDYSSRFLHTMFSVPTEDYVVNPVIAKALDVVFTLHADHEQNASTSTVRMSGSTGSNPYTCMASGIAALWGAAHGGANEAVLMMLQEIGDVKKVPEFIKRVKDKDDNVRLMGFGHRVYKNFDPRSKIIKKMLQSVLEELSIQDPLLEIALALEEIALHDEYFLSRRLYPNVDFYSGILLRAIGIPTNLFTAIFVLGRTSGWISHWLEMHSDQFKIYRPRQLYVGKTLRQVP